MEMACHAFYFSPSWEVICVKLIQPENTSAFVAGKIVSANSIALRIGCQVQNKVHIWTQLYVMRLNKFVNLTDEGVSIGDDLRII